MSRRRAHIDFSSANFQSLHRLYLDMSDLRWVDKSLARLRIECHEKLIPKMCVCVLPFCDVIQCLFSHLPRFRALYRSMQWKFFKILKFLFSLMLLWKTFSFWRSSAVLWDWDSLLGRKISLNMLYEQKNLNKNFHKENWKIFSRISTHKLVRCFSVFVSFSFTVP